MADKQIRVDEKVHGQVAKIAESNFRGIGDQVAYWAANDCPHPTKMREMKDMTISIMEDGKSTDTILRVFYCKQCRRHIVLEDNAQTELSKKIGELVAA